MTNGNSDPGDLLSFAVPGEPVPCERARVFRARNGKMRGVTPQRTRAFEERVGWFARAAVVAARWSLEREARYALTLHVYRKRAAGDWDNFGKSCADGMNGIVWADDGQICEAHVYLAIDRANPRIEIEVRRTACGSNPRVLGTRHARIVTHRLFASGSRICATAGASGR